MSIAGVQSPDSPCSSQNSQPPIPYEQLQHTVGPEAASTLPLRPSNPLKSFAVPGPPGVFRVGPTASPTTPGSKKGGPILTHAGMLHSDVGIVLLSVFKLHEVVGNEGLLDARQQTAIRK